MSQEIKEIGDSSLTLDRSKKLGSHGNSSTVFQGNFIKDSKQQVVAIKRYSIDLVSSEDLTKISHPNIACVLHIAKDEDFRYVAMELGKASLDHLFIRNDKNRKYNGLMPTNKQVLLQLAKGLKYLHSLNIMHGNIKPENILISLTSPVQMKWTDFGFRRPRKGSYSVSQSATRMGSSMWWAPEMYKDEENVSEKGEIFSAGCVFLYFLSGGRHPFGTPALGEFIIGKNVIKGDIVHPVDLSVEELDFVGKMIKTNPDDRIPLKKVIENLEILERPNSIVSFQSLQYEEKGYQNGQYSCGLCVLKSKEFVVKRIPIDYSSQKPIEEFKKLNHSNIIRILHFEEQESYKYFGMEFCAASLDQFFLPEGHEKKYAGPMPSHAQVFFQIVTGLQYIHDNNLVHGSIKPTNILISSSQDPQIKLSEFGITVHRWNKINSSHVLAEVKGFQSERYWMAPELLSEMLEIVERNGQSEKLNPTEQSDVFATGKVFFYYYTFFYNNIIFNSMSPSYSSTVNQGNNVFENLPVMDYRVIDNRKRHIPHWLITNMTKEDPKIRWSLSTVIERVKLFSSTPGPRLSPPDGDNLSQYQCQFSRNHILGTGSFGTIHLGLWKNQGENTVIVAIKRIGLHGKKRTILIQREEDLQKFHHENIVKFFGSERDLDFIYIAMENCLVSLKSYCSQLQLYQGVIPMPSDQQVLLQMAEGLKFIHSKNIIHRDVKPGNILISGDRPAILKWADFGVSKEGFKTGSKTWTCRQGSEGWMAPEVDQDGKVIAGKESDIFSLGCVFFFFLTPAIHPFGNEPPERKANIKELIDGKKPQNISKLPEDHFAIAIIKKMIEFKPEERILISDLCKKLRSLAGISSPLR